MLRGVKMVSVGQMSVVGGCFVVAFVVVQGGLMVMACSVLVMLRCLSVVMGCLLRHGRLLSR